MGPTHLSTACVFMRPANKYALHLNDDCTSARETNRQIQQRQATRNEFKCTSHHHRRCVESLPCLPSQTGPAIDGMVCLGSILFASSGPSLGAELKKPM